VADALDFSIWKSKLQLAANPGGAVNSQVVLLAIRTHEEEEESAMRKCAITAVALLATASMSMGGMASLSFGPTELFSGTVAEIPVWATGDSEVECMGLGLEVRAPLEIVSVIATDPGFYFYPSDDKGVFWIDRQVATCDVFNPNPAVVDLPPLSATPALMAMVRVYVPADTPAGVYSISTVVSAWGYASVLSYDGVLLDVTQAQMFMPLDTPEPATVLLLLGVLPFVRRRLR
jgi:hypothetical protein